VKSLVTVFELAKRDIWATLSLLCILAIATWGLVGCGGSGNGGSQQGTTVVNQPQQQERTQ
jgi:hypothetical protein